MVKTSDHQCICHLVKRLISVQGLRFQQVLAVAFMHDENEKTLTTVAQGRGRGNSLRYHKYATAAPSASQPKTPDARHPALRQRMRCLGMRHQVCHAPRHLHSY